jgi:regulator of cell morphogenesis and NO signaling
MTQAVGTRRVLDTRTLQSPGRCETVFATFDALAPGDSLVVITDHAPSLLNRLQSERAGTFEWSPLEEGPPVWRTEITRRAADAGSLRAVTEALSWDHDRLEVIEQRAFEAHAAGDAAGAVAAWKEFAHGLERHIRFEEQVLFPVFEERTGAPPAAGPTAVMRIEHREIEGLLDEIAAALEGATDALPLRARLHRVLRDHNMKEERILYPATDQALDEGARDEVVRRIQRS